MPAPPSSPVPSVVAPPSNLALGRGARVRRRPRPDPYDLQIRARAGVLRRQALQREARAADAMHDQPPSPHRFLTSLPFKLLFH